MERTNDAVLDTFAEFGHPIDVKLMAQELRARRDADLTVEELEAVRELISYTSSDLPASSCIAYQAIAKIIGTLSTPTRQRG